MATERKTTVYFGGEAHELWREDGLSVTYSNRTPVVAVVDGDHIRAEAPEPGRGGDVKAVYNELAAWRELAMRLNAGEISPLSSAYFRSAADVSLALESTGDNWRGLPEHYRREVHGGVECIALIELLRTLLDEKHAAWEEAVNIVSSCFTLRIENSSALTPVPLAAVRALQMRDASLIETVNDKLCSRLWNAWPGDWLRIGGSAILRDGEADFNLLAAYMCSRVYCTKEELAFPLRALYTLEPARFIEL